MEKLTEVLAMGGYAAFVWPSFGIAAIVLLAMAIGSLRALRKARRSLSELQNASVPQVANHES